MAIRLADVNAMILAGGLGTRLRSVVNDRAKVMAVVTDRPFLTYLFDQLLSVGIAQVVLCTGYRSRQLRDCLGEAYKTLSIVYSEETTPLGTAGALRLALPTTQSDPVLVMNGDSYCGGSLEELWRCHIRFSAAATMMLALVPDVGRYGAVRLKTNSELAAFEEKAATSGAGLINAGIYLIQRRLIEAVSAGRPISMERDVFPQWIGRGLYGYATNGKFLDIGTPDSYARAPAFFAGH